MKNRFKAATLAVAAFSILSLTACGEEVKNAAEGAKDTVGKTATEGVQKAGEGAMKAGEGAQKAGEGAMKAADTAKVAVGDVADKAKGAMGSLVALKDSIPGLKDSAGAAITAAKTGDFKTAQAEVTKVQESWGKVSEMVKTRSGGSFEKVSSTLKTVQTELKAPTPDKTKVLAELTSLSSAVSGLASVK
jgi:hypothetical protein